MQQPSPLPTLERAVAVTPRATPSRDSSLPSSLYDEMQRLSCTERLRLNDRALNAALKLRRAFDSTRR